MPSRIQVLDAVASTMATIEANLSALDISSDQSVAHVGDMRALRGILSDRCFPKSDSAKPATLRMVVFGGSMTDGSMNCLSMHGVVCTARFKPSRLAWRSVLYDLLRQGLPGCKIRVRTAVHPASRSDVLLALPTLIDKGEALAIEDFTVNDQRGTIVTEGRINDTKKLRSTIAAHEVLALSARSHNASLLLMESFAKFGRPPMCTPYDDHLHRVVSRAYALTIISIIRAVFSVAERESYSSQPVRRHWVAGCGTLNQSGMDCEPHPGPHTHQIYAWLLARYILRQATVAFSGLDPDRDEQPTPTEPPALLAPNELEMLRGCAPTLIATSINAAESCGTPHHTSDSWRCYEDVPGKRGWIVDGRSSSSAVRDSPRDITFMMRATRDGKLVVGYLRSYEGMGRASLFFNGNVSAAITLDGRWADRTSQTHYDVFPLRLVAAHANLIQSHHHPSRLMVTLRLLPEQDQELDQPGKSWKFKLTHLTSC